MATASTIVIACAQNSTLKNKLPYENFGQGLDGPNTLYSLSALRKTSTTEGPAMMLMEVKCSH